MLIATEWENSLSNLASNPCSMKSWVSPTKSILDFPVTLGKRRGSAFTDNNLRRIKKPRNPNHHRAIRALSTAFRDTCLQSNEDAKRGFKAPVSEPSCNQRTNGRQKSLFVLACQD